MDNKRMENDTKLSFFRKLLKEFRFVGKQKNGKQKWKTNNITYLLQK